MNIIIGILAFLMNNNYLLYILLIVYLFFMICYSKKHVIIIPKTKNFIILFITCLSYLFFSSIVGTRNITVFIYPIIMYMIGTIYFSSHSDEKSMKKIIECISIGLFIHALLNYLTNINASNRNIIDIFTRMNFSATLQATFVIFILSTSFSNIYFNKTFKRIFYIICLIISILFLLLIGNRTGFLITIITFIFSLFLVTFFSNKSSEDKKKKYKTLFLIVISTISILYMYNSNFFNVKNTIESSNLYLRFNTGETEISDESRISHFNNGVSSLLAHPLGTNGKLEGSLYAHNMWLDIGKDAGIISFFLLVIYSIFSVKSLIILNRLPNLTKEFKIYLNSLYLGVNINFFVEPILEALPFYFSLFVFVNAMVDMKARLLKNEYNERINK